ncbi:MAG: DNA repair protein RecO [Bacillales bacterium]|nr:DNA repair protein RecO [Bacillales bacterium]
MKELTGFVIQLSDYSNSDLIMNILTENGSETISCKGVKKISSKNKSLCQLYSKINIEVDDKSKYLILRQGTILKFPELAYKSLVTNYVLGVFTNFLMENIKNNLDFEKAYLSLEQLTNQESDIITLIKVLFLILSLSGNQINVEACVSCGSSKVSSFSLSEGGFYCSNCSLERLEKAELQKIRRFLKSDLLSESELPHSFLNTSKLVKDLFEIIKEQTGITIRNSNLFKDIF